MLVAYPLPDKGLRYSIKAWEWTVYFDNGVWRCLRDDKPNNVLRFSFLYKHYLLIVKFGGIRDTKKHLYYETF